MFGSSHSTYTFTLEDHEDDLVEMLAAIAVFTADKQTLAKIQKKGKVPKKGLKEEKRFLRIAKAILEKRLSQYPHSFDVGSFSKLCCPTRQSSLLIYELPCCRTTTKS